MNGAEAFLNDIKKIKQQRVKNANTIIGHLNINSFRNKFFFAEEIIQVFYYFFFLSESKLHNTSPTKLFKINDYKIFRYDQNRFGGGLFLYVNEQVPCRLLQRYHNFSNLEILVLQISATSRFIFVLFERYGHPKKFLKKVLFPYIFHVKLNEI